MVCRVLQEERTVDDLALIILCNTETSSAFVCICVCVPAYVCACVRVCACICVCMIRLLAVTQVRTSAYFVRAGGR